MLSSLQSPSVGFFFSLTLLRLLMAKLNAPSKVIVEAVTGCSEQLNSISSQVVSTQPAHDPYWILHGPSPAL